MIHEVRSLHSSRPNTTSSQAVSQCLRQRHWQERLSSHTCLCWWGNIQTPHRKVLPQLGLESKTFLLNTETPFCLQRFDTICVCLAEVEALAYYEVDAERFFKYTSVYLWY